MKGVNKLLGLDLFLIAAMQGGPRAITMRPQFFRRLECRDKTIDFDIMFGTFLYGVDMEILAKSLRMMNLTGHERYMEFEKAE